MGILASILNPPRPQAQWAPTDDRWYVQDPSGFIAESGAGGFSVSGATILRCTTVLAAVRFRALSWAQCPPQTFRRTARGREDAPDHYSQVLLRNPTSWLTAFEWQCLHGVRLSVFGQSFAEIISERAFAEQLRPVNPLHVTVADQRADGSLLYVVRVPGQQERRLGSAELIHFRDLTEDGIRGVETYRQIHQSVAIALLAEQHASTFLRKGARIAGLLVPTNGALTPAQRGELASSVNTELGGVSKTGTLGILPHGVELKQLSSTNRDGQVIELDDRAVGSILRGLGVPGVAVGWSGDKASTYASAKEFYESGGIRHCVQPIVVGAEQRLSKSLLPEGGPWYIKYNLDVLLRGNIKERYEALYRAVGGPFLAVNEAREIEDWNPHPDKRHDQILTPSNMAPELLGDPAPEPAPRRRPAPRDDEDGAEASRAQAPGSTAPAQIVVSTVVGPVLARLREFAEDAAERIVAFEEKKLAGIDGRNADALRARVAEVFGVRHVEHVAQALRISTDDARAYVAIRGMDLMQGKPVGREALVQQLASLAMVRAQEEVA